MRYLSGSPNGPPWGQCVWIMANDLSVQSRKRIYSSSEAFADTIDHSSRAINDYMDDDFSDVQAACTNSEDVLRF